MNKLGTLSEIRREKKESSLSGNINSKDELLSNTEEYFNFKVLLYERRNYYGL